MKFGGIWSFIVGAQVACTLLFVPAAVGIFTTLQRVEVASVSDGALPHLPPQDGQRGAGRRARCA